MDRSLAILGAVIALSTASAAMWHSFVRTYAWAVVGSALTVGLITDLAYPLIRGVSPSVLIVVDALVLGAAIALGVGIPFKRGRHRQGR